MDPKADALVRFAQRVVETRGRVEDADMDEARRAGLDEATLVEIIANVALHIFTNFFNLVARTDVDFPPTPALATGPIATA